MSTETERVKWFLLLEDATMTSLAAEAQRVDRSLSWAVEHAWKLMREAIAAWPSERGVELRCQALRTEDAVLALRNEEVPDGFLQRSIFLRGATAAEIEGEVERLGLTTWELLAFCVPRAMPQLREVPSANE